MVQIKICGLKSMKDIQYMNRLPIAYAGFVFAHSPRQITPATAANLIAQLQQAQSVGVFVNEELHKMIQIAAFCSLDVIQLHGDEDDTIIQQLKEQTNCKIWKALRIQSAKDFRMMKDLHPHRFLIDTYQEGAYGGTGHTVSKDLLTQINMQEIILAGGINQSNIKDKLSLHPFCLDLSSGVETDGNKDFNKMKQLIKEVYSI